MGTAWGQDLDVKVDLLGPPPGGHAVLEADRVRAKRRKGGNPLHGRVTPEAIAADERRLGFARGNLLGRSVLLGQGLAAQPPYPPRDEALRLPRQRRAQGASPNSTTPVSTPPTSTP